MGILCAQLLLHFYADYFETLQVLLSWSEDLHVVLIYNPLIILCCIFQDVILDMFRPSMLSMSIYNVQDGAFCAQLLLQFYIIRFKTLHVLMPRPEEINVPSITFSD